MQHSHSVLRSGYFDAFTVEINLSFVSTLLQVYVFVYRRWTSVTNAECRAKANATGQESLWNSLRVEAFVSLSLRYFFIWSLIRTAKD